MNAYARRLLPTVVLVSAFALQATAQTIALPAPRKTGGMPLREALAARATARDFAPTPLTPQEISDLLWAAWGYNRPAKRTAPTAMNRQEITLYAYTDEGVFRYEPGPDENRLVCLTREDKRASAGFQQPFIATAPLILVYVVDMNKMRVRDDPAAAARFAAVDCGFVGQNVYLHAASEGLHTCFIGRVDAERVGPVLGLSESQIPLFAQVVGHPATSAEAKE